MIFACLRRCHGHTVRTVTAKTTCFLQQAGIDGQNGRHAEIVQPAGGVRSVFRVPYAVQSPIFFSN